MRLRVTKLSKTASTTVLAGGGGGSSFNFDDINISGVVAHYKFNGNGNNSVSGSHNLSAVGTPTYETGKFGNCVVVDATNYLAGAPTLNIGTGSASWSVWFRVEDWSIGNQMILWKDNYSPRITATSASSGVNGFVTSTFVPGDVFNNNGLLSGGFFAGNQWRHVVLVINRATNMMSTWIDGIKAVQPGGEADITTLGSSNVTGIGNVIIGGEGLNTIKVDSISVFNKALSDTEIGQLYNSGTGRDYTG